MGILSKKIILLTLLFFSTTLFANIAKVVALQGDASVIREGQTLNITRKTKIFKHDEIKTKANSKVQILFNDNTVISVGSNSSFQVFNYLYDEKNNKFEAKFSMIKGTFRTITGKIGKIAPKKFSLETKAASIGIRGTQVVMNLSKDTEQIFCTEGKILVTKLNSKVSSIVNAGEFVSFKTNEKTKFNVRKIKKSDIQKINKKITVNSNLASDNISNESSLNPQTSNESENNTETKVPTEQEETVKQEENEQEDVQEVTAEKTVVEEETDEDYAKDKLEEEKEEAKKEEKQALENARKAEEDQRQAEAEQAAAEEAQRQAEADQAAADEAASQAAAEQAAAQEAQRQAEAEQAAADEAASQAATAEIEAAEAVRLAEEQAASAITAEEQAVAQEAIRIAAEEQAAAQEAARIAAEEQAAAQEAARIAAEEQAAAQEAARIAAEEQAAAQEAARIAAEEQAAAEEAARIAAEKQAAAEEAARKLAEEEAQKQIYKKVNLFNLTPEDYINNENSTATYKGNFNSKAFNDKDQYLKDGKDKVAISTDSTISMDVDFGAKKDHISNGKIKTQSGDFDFDGKIKNAKNAELELKGENNTSGDGNATLYGDEAQTMRGNVNFKNETDDIEIKADFDANKEGFEDNDFITIDDITPESFFNDSNSIATYKGDFNNYSYNKDKQYMKNVNGTKIEVPTDTTISMDIDFGAENDHISNGKINVNDIANSHKETLTFDGHIHENDAKFHIDPTGSTTGSRGEGHFYGGNAEAMRGDVNFKSGTSKIEIKGEFDAAKQ